MTSLPRDLWPDVTLPLIADPYRAIARRARRIGRDGFRSRLLGQPAIFLTGAEAAAFFYEPGRFHRHKAVPELVAHVLFGDGGVQRLDGAPHRMRKALWLDLATEGAADALGREVERVFDDAIPELQALSSLDVFIQSSRILTEAVCRWAGVPLARHEVDGVCEMLSSLFLHAAALGPEHLLGRSNRRRATLWARALVRAAREGRGPAGALAQIARWQDDAGSPLPEDVAATEVLNLLRPVVAVAVYATFVAMAIGRHPDHRERLAADGAFRSAFVQEVRRVYPFFPAVAARTCEPTVWRGEEIAAGTRTVLDLHGTCRDPSAWTEPDRFRPERFIDWAGDPWAMIPQGGGAPDQTHRCPGEWIAVRLMSIFAHRLARARYDIATPEARPNWRAAPALPRGGFVLTGFRAG